MNELVRPHAKLGASNSERWMNCAGSGDMISSLPVQPSPSRYALEGTTMHKAGEYALRTGLEPPWSTYSYTVYENGSAVAQELDQECIEAVTFYVDVIAADLKAYGGKLFVEQQFTLERVRPDMWGTNDALIAYCTDGVLRVYDFKGGRGYAVEAFGNKQLRYYGLGAVLNLPNLKVKEVELVIVQPRARHPQGPVRRWRIPLLDLYDFKVELLEAARATDQPGAPLRAGDWCEDTFCPARGMCREYRRYAEEKMQLDFSKPPVVLPHPQTMNGTEVGEMMLRFKYLREYMASVEAAGHAMLERGIPVKGWKLADKRGRRKWNGTDAETAEALLALGLQEKQIVDIELKSPAQIEKMLPKDLRKRLETLCEMVSSGSALVPEDDPRPAVTPKGTLGFETQPTDGDMAALPPALR